MHLKKVVKREGGLFIEHFVIVDAIDGADTYYEKLTLSNCWKYFHEIFCYIVWYRINKKIKKRKGRYSPRV